MPSFVWQIFFVAIITLFFLSVLYWQKDAVGRFAWTYFKNDSIAIALSDLDARTLNEIGEYYFNSGAYDTEKARFYFRKSLQQNDSQYFTHYQLGRLYFLNGLFPLAIREFNTTLELSPAFPRTYYMRGLTYAYMKRFDSAIADFNKFIEIIPNEWASYNDLAWIYFQQGDFENALEITDKGLEYASANVWLRMMRGVVLLNLKDYQNAKQELTVAFAGYEKLTPEDWGRAYPGNDPAWLEEGLREMGVIIRFNLGATYAKLGEYENAEREMRMFLATVSENDPRREEVRKFLEEGLGE